MATTFNINFGEKKKGAVSPMTIVYYDEEFSTNNREVDFIEDFTKLGQSMSQFGVINAMKLMRLIWACEKTYVQGIFPNFKSWVAMLSQAQMDDKETYLELAGAIQSEFFRSKQDQSEESKETQN